MSSAPEFHVIIPARYGSSRFPGKPLAKVAGREMILRVVDQARRSGAASVVVATDDDRIAQVVNREALPGAQAVMTRADHPSGSDRVLEAAQLQGLPADALVVNVQGDEPLIPPEAIVQTARLLSSSPEIGAATLSEPIRTVSQLHNPNIVKVVCDTDGRALYFSRAPIPYARGVLDRLSGDEHDIKDLPVPEGLWQRHIGIYGYRLATLEAFVALPVAQLESVESLEQLRLLANGISLMVGRSVVPMPGGVDTPDDLRQLEVELGPRQPSAP